MNKLTNTKINNFCSLKDTKNRGKRKVRVERTFAEHKSGKGLTLYKELQSINRNRKKSQWKYRYILNNHFTNEYTQIVNKHIKRCLTAVVTKEVRMETTMQYI